jgi:hypothetical protein
MPADYIFTMTTGRSGTMFLANLLRENLPQSVCYHEILGWDTFEVDTPDLSHMTLFNSKGNERKVRLFWKQKLERVATTLQPFYVETSHVLMKAGLLENLRGLTTTGRVHLISLERDICETIKSFRRRYDFLNKENVWLWYLDPKYPKNLTLSEKFIKRGTLNEICLWYVIEARTRARYYTKLLEAKKNVVIHKCFLERIREPQGAAELFAELGARIPPDKVKIPLAANESRGARLGESQEQGILDLIHSTEFDADALANEAIQRGAHF